MDKVKLIGILSIVFIAIALIGIFNPIVMVKVGQRGIVVTLGNPSEKIKKEGAHLILPIIQELVTMDVRTQKKQVKTEVYTKDIQQARIEYVLNYNLSEDGVYDMLTKVGMNYEDKMIIPTVEGVIKNVIGKWNAQDLVANRELATKDIYTILSQELKNSKIIVSNFQITDLNYSDVFEKAIENKVTAEQEALKAKNKTVQIQEEAKQKIIAAEAEAKSMAIRAQALTQNKALVEYEAVQKWNGKLPEYMLGDTVPFLNLDKKVQNRR